MQSRPRSERHLSSLPVLWPEGLEHGGGRGSEVGAVLRKDLVVVRTAAGSRGVHATRAPGSAPALATLHQDL